MNKIMLKEIEHQVTLAVGSLSLVTGATDDDELFIARTRAQLVGIVYGLRNVIDNIALDEINENINVEFLKDMERDATWGNN